jgi:hypothetical protein
MKDPIYTDSEIDKFLEKADFDLITEVHESQMIEDNLTFDQFLQRYQPLHKQKYGKKLNTEK